MNYEQKYKEALERAKKLYEQGTITESLNYIFPELEESEDERIRKELIKFVKVNIPDEERYIVWLEKQCESKVSEPNWCHHKVDLSDCSEEYRKAYYDGWNNCNIQHSQCNEERNDVVKCLINGMKFYYEDNEDATWGTDKWSMPVKHIIEVLEKQCEKKIEPKFKVGDWIIHHGTENIYQVVAVIDNQYQLRYGDNYTIQKCDDVDRNARLWNISDAKPGDVLYYKSDNNIEYIVMNKGINMHGNIDSYFRYNSLDGFAVDVPAVLSVENDNITLATREQRDLLFSKMKEAGYEWNAEKKEIKKVEDEPKNYKQQVMSEMTDLVKDYIKQKPSWSEEDEKNLQGIIDEIEANKNEAPSYDLSTYDKYLNWLKSLKNKIKNE